MQHSGSGLGRIFPLSSAKPRNVVSGIVAGLAAAAVVNHFLARRAERRNPPAGDFISVDGVRLHYVERGSGPVLVLLHGNGSTIQDFQSSGLLDLAARKYRVIAFDRPGFGYSERPRNTIWTPQAQAALIHAALMRLGASEVVVLGHSWGTLVAVALALGYPQNVKALILASGYYYPTARADVVAFSPPALPVVGDILSHTISPFVARLIWPLLLYKIFGPSPVPPKFQGFSEEMAVRPSQLRAAAAESALMIPGAHSLQADYPQLHMPVLIIAGADDKFIERQQSIKLHQAVPHSALRLVSGNGHMVHQTATAEIVSAIDEALDRSQVATSPVRPAEPQVHLAAH